MSTKKIVESKSAPAAIGPYSQAVWAGDLLFTSGQIPLDPATGQVVVGNVEDQTRQSLKNIQAVLTEAGLTLADVVKSTVFIKDMNDFPRINEVYSTFFPTACPARSCVEVARLPKDVLVEIEVIARKG